MPAPSTSPLLPGAPRPPRLRLLLLAVLVALAAVPLRASIVRLLGLPELLARAEVVAVATVESAVSSWVGGRIVTDSTLRLDEPIRGGARGDSVTVRTLGGEVDGIGQRVFGEPWFRPGERYLVFLERFPGAVDPPRFRPVGMAQGALPVLDTPEGPVVAPPPDPPLCIVPSAAASVAPWLDAPRPLDAALAELRAAAAEAAP